jgi:polyisoprenyl-teichoic acid--peptidoglycan teichoic acid transferase
MSFLKKKPEIVFDESGDRTPVKFSRTQKFQKPGNRVDEVAKKAKRKKIRRAVLWTILILVLGTLGFFGFRAYQSINKIFANGSGNVLDLFNGSTAKPLKGESRGRTNILLLGVGDPGHDGENLTDSILILSIDYKTNNIALFSIPRDTYVKIPGYGSNKINSANVFGENKQKGSGPALVEQTVTGSFGLPIDYYAMVNFSGLKQAVDAVGGVTVNVDNTFCDYNYPTEYKGDTSTVCFTAGPQTLNGVKALQYSRSRHSLQAGEGSDFARSKRQQKVLIGLKEKLQSTNTTYNPKTVLNLLTVLGNNVKTDFQLADFARLYDIAKKVDQSKIIQKSFDNSPEGMLVADSSTAAGYILIPKGGNWKQIQAAVANIFNTVGVKTEKATISVLNGTWSSGLATVAGDSLKADGYNVTNTGDYTPKTVKKTIIIDNTNGKKPATITALEKYFGVTATKATAGATAPAYEIQITLGTDYSAK